MCIYCARGGCRTIEVILDGDMEKSWFFPYVVGRYEKVTSLYNGKCQWVRLDEIRGTKISYDNDKNVWKIGYLGDYLRTVQDVPCPTVANTFEYRYGRSQWKPAPINSIIIKHVK